MTRSLAAVAGVAVAAVVLAAPVPAAKKNQWLIASAGQIYLYTEGDKEPKKLTESKAHAEHPAWSPDGKRFAFSEYHGDGYAHLWLMDIEGKSATQLTSGEKYQNARPTWTPDGKRIVFQRIGDGGFEICTADSSDGSDLQVVRNSGRHYPSCSPDGKSIAFLSVGDSETQLHKMQIDGKEVVKLLAEPVCGVSVPAWSPSGKWIAFSTWRDLLAVEIHVVRADGTDLKPLTKFGKMALSPSWSPDGTKIAFVCDNQGERERQTALWVMDADGGNQKEILKLGKQHIQAVAWRPK